MEKIKVFYKKVGEEPVVMEIEDTLETKQKLVGGYIEVVPFIDEILLVCNEEGKIMNMETNLVLGLDYIAGDCFFIGDDYENADFRSLTDEEIEIIKKELLDENVDFMGLTDEDMEFIKKELVDRSFKYPKNEE